MDNIIIAVSGKIGSGKNTVCDIISNHFANTKVLAFADDLKKFVSIITNLPLELMYTEEGKNTYVPSYNMSVGEMLQKIGTDALRTHFDTDIWVKSLFNKIQENDTILIPDLRFKNEAQYSKQKGAILIRINGDPLGHNKNSKRNTNHISETDLDDWTDWDYIIDNNSSLKDLEHKVYDILSKII